jgi:signal transduction histidine kinase
MEPNEGVLQIISRKEDNKCVVEVADNGKGMTAEELDKLFEPFFTTKTQGNGLGLTNMQNIILNHKATVNVYSTVGVGTRFVIKFDLP